MSQFQAAFLEEDAAADDGLHLAVFGKHPAWDDHMQDFGLCTPSLSLLKQRLYVEGIGENLARGVWSSSPAEGGIIAFHHRFIWERGGRWLCGRIVESADGKGRTLYPLILAVQGAGKASRLLATVLGKELTTLEYQLRQATSRDEVALTVAKADDRLHLLLDDLEAAPSESSSTAEQRQRFMARVEAEGSQVTLGGVLACVSGSKEAPTVHLRFPERSAHAQTDLMIWKDLLRVAIDSSVPLLLLHPETEPFIDVLIGEPNTEALQCLKRSLASLPASGGLSSARSSAVATMLSAFLNPETSSPESPNAPHAPRRRRFRFWDR